MTEVEWLQTRRFRAALQVFVAPPAASGVLGRVRGWLKAPRPAPRSTSKRQMLLALAGIGRRLWAASGHGNEAGHREWIERCERFADGCPTPEDQTILGPPYGPGAVIHAEYLFYPAALRAPSPLAAVQRIVAELAPTLPALTRLINDYFPEESPRGCDALREIFGNPFRPVTLSPSWRTDTVLTLATQMYESRDFGAMPILGDALQDAGCDSADVLDHCRGDGPHVRGCWVVDQVLGKE